MPRKIFFVGIGGSGMSALSQMALWDSNSVSGSDRDFDNGKNLRLKRKFEEMGIKIFTQDGRGIRGDLDEIVVSTAVEEDNPDIKKAMELRLPLRHRSDLLSSYVERFRTVAVAGTSGKSTVAAMLFEILDGNGFSPGIINGAEVNILKKNGFIGNARMGKGDTLVMEADESDGSIMKYEPEIGILLNISRDHKSVAELSEIFRIFSGNCGTIFIHSSCRGILPPDARAVVFPDEKLKPENVEFRGFDSFFEISGVRFRIPLPGTHNVENAFAAARVALHLGVDLRATAAALENYKGTFRRFNVVGEKNGIRVIDDYAHNPAKIRAVLSSLGPARKGRVIAIYQPHGFAPARKLRKELVESFSVLSEKDILVFPEIFYAGGTVAKAISSRDLAEDAVGMGIRAFFIPRKKDIIKFVSAEAESGDIVIVMGARDSSLSALAESILNAAGKPPEEAA